MKNATNLLSTTIFSLLLVRMDHSVVPLSKNVVTADSYSASVGAEMLSADCELKEFFKAFDVFSVLFRLGDTFLDTSSLYAQQISAQFREFLKESLGRERKLENQSEQEF